MIPWDATLQSSPDHSDLLARGCPPGHRVQFTSLNDPFTTPVPPYLLPAFQSIYDLDFSTIGLRCVPLTESASEPYDTNPGTMPTYHDPLAWLPALPNLGSVTTLALVAIGGMILLNLSSWFRRP